MGRSVSRIHGGIDRKTHKMMERDIMAARDAWLEEAKDAEELERRLKSDFLCYCKHDGLFADFHSMRHLFITSLERAGVKPKMAQTLARHSDIRLTLDVYIRTFSDHAETPFSHGIVSITPYSTY